MEQNPHTLHRPGHPPNTGLEIIYIRGALSPTTWQVRTFGTAMAKYMHSSDGGQYTHIGIYVRHHIPPLGSSDKLPGWTEGSILFETQHMGSKN